MRTVPPPVCDIPLVSTSGVDAELLTQKQIAALAQISQRKLQRLEAAGQGPTRTVLGDRTIRYTRRAYAEWVNARTATAGST